MSSHRTRERIAGSIREIVFGLEDSLVSTLGAVTGIAAGTHSTYVVVLSGLVLVAVEAVSMAAGTYLSSKSVTEAEAAIEREDKKRLSHLRVDPVRAALVMGGLYVLGGLIPLSAYLVVPIETALVPSVVLTAVALYSVGVWKATITKRSKVRSGIEMVTISLGAAALGYAIGRIVSTAFGADSFT